VLGGTRVVITFHHAILDGRSVTLLLDEVISGYSALRAGRVPHYPQRPEFADFVRWQGAADLGPAAEFWRANLAGVTEHRALPGFLSNDHSGPSGRQASGPSGRQASGPSGRPGADETSLSRADSDRVRALAASAGASPAAVLGAAWALLRGAYAGTSDVTFAVTRSCRYGSVPGADDIVGLLISTVPLRVRLDQSRTARDLVADVAARTRALRDHQLAPLASILGWAGLRADPPPLDSLLVFERERPHTALACLGPELARASVRVRRLPGFPLTLYGFDEPELCLTAMWDSRRMLDASARHILAQLRDTMRELAARPAARLPDLDLGARAEARLRARWNQTSTPYPREATVTSLVAAQVARQPDAPALIASGTTVSYAELDATAGQLAAALVRRGAGPEVLVGVALPRGPALIGALLGILRAGGAYLPLDLSAPPARTAAVLAASGARLVLTDVAHAGSLPADGSVVVLDADTLAGTRGWPARRARGLPARRAQGSSAPVPAIHPQNLAYVGYTSGSTGRPKGVAIPHRGVVRLVSVCLPRGSGFARLGPGERVLQFAPVAFDASTLEVWGALCTGATLVIAPPDPVGLAELGALLRSGQVTVAWLTCGLFHQLAETDPSALAGVGQVLTGGDVVSPAALRIALAARDGRPIVNGYGPTENTTFTSYQQFTAPDEIGERVPIGRPVPQTTVHVLDAGMRPVPVGVTGELYAGGDGLARGYLGDPAATARSFVPDPGGSGQRLYRTGDLARWRADGALEFLGRRDDQVKIRGFRAEPGEVAAVLAAHPAVGEAAVAVRGEGEGRYLAAYVTPAGRTRPAASALRESVLREFAAARLPAYLLPASYTVLDRLPLTANGKLDRAALPAPGNDAAREPASGPVTPTELRLAHVWAGLLHDGPAPASIGREVSFFALGGNSLTAARLVSRARDAFGVDLAVGDFYAEPTLAAMAEAIDAAGPATAAGQPAVTRRERAAYQVSDPAEVRGWPAGGASGHLIGLTRDWFLWKVVCLRGAGFPFDLLSALGDEDLAEAADRADDVAYAAEFALAERRLGRALAGAARLPALREAVTWQNPHALATGIDALLRRDPDEAVRNTKHRQHETLVASYLQRYCAKNDTIGFFGPVGWAAFGSGQGIAIRNAHPPALVSARTTYLEGWAVTAVMTPHTAALRPWLVPRLMPYIRLAGATLRVPLAAPVPLDAAQAAVLRACDGIRNASEVAAVVLAGKDGGLTSAGQVHALLAASAGQRRIAWQVEVPPNATRPEEYFRKVLDRVTDETVRTDAAQSLDALCAARDALAAAAGDADGVATAMTALQETFTRLAGTAPVRRSGGMYAGRTPVYEDCRRAGEVEFGVAMLDQVRAALGLVLDSARWFTAAGAAVYRRLLSEIYRRRAAELGSEVVPFADVWLRVPEILFDPPAQVTAPLIRGLRQRWAQVLAVPADHGGRVTRTAAELAEAVGRVFAAGQPGWPTAVQHSPDLMIATGPDGPDGTDGPVQWVLGELHPGINTLRYATWVSHHDDPAALRKAMAADLGRAVVYAAETGAEGGLPARQSNALASQRDLRFTFAHDSFWPGQAEARGKPRTLAVGDCDLVETAAGLRVRWRDGGIDLDVIEVLGDLIAAALAQRFRVLAPEPHAPRVTVDGLVISRESWTFRAGELGFAASADETRRYREARTWASAAGLPRHVFVRSAGEGKPVYADLTSLASVDLLSRSVRRASRHAGDAAEVTVTEMLPAPDQLWLADESGRRYCAELRVVAVDRAGDRKEC
jgi:amino acid adenylation domain-containing protein